MIALKIKHPAGRTKTRKFSTKAEAAKYGIAYYLADNRYADPRAAGFTAGVFLETGEASCDGIDFWTEEEATA